HLQGAGKPSLRNPHRPAAPTARLVAVEDISPTFCDLGRVELRPARTLLVTDFVINQGGQREAGYVSLPVKPANLMPARNVSLHLAPLSRPGLGLRGGGDQLKTPPL